MPCADTFEKNAPKDGPAPPICCRQATVYDPDTAFSFLNEAVLRAMEFAFLNANRYLPRPKERLTLMDSWQSHVAGLIRAHHRAADNTSRWQAAVAISEEALGVVGFYGWESDPDLVEPA